MNKAVERAGLSVAPELVRFLEDRAIPGTGVDAKSFWDGLALLYARFTPENRALLARRDELQSAVDGWNRTHRGQNFNREAYVGFLREIGYLVPEPEGFRINPLGVDDEVAAIAGAQLVVPILNARFLLNAANARWGSLYDALYGSDAIQEPSAAQGYDAVRGAEVIAWGRRFLDDAVPLTGKSHAEVDSYCVLNEELRPALVDPFALAGYSGSAEAPTAILLRHNGLHIEIRIDRSHAIGRADRAGIADVVLESALTTICDLEDSVVAVDAEDKVTAYANWLGLMQGKLEATFAKAGRQVRRRLAEDREYKAPDGSALVLPGRSLLFVRNVGHLMTTPALRLEDGSEAFEGILDAVVTTLGALHDLRAPGGSRNSRAGSIYIVKPKMHGPDEVAFTNRLFDAVEDLLGLDRHTIKVGVMDEERRTSANLAACIEAVKDRIVFINTGFLDRTGDEIHTSMDLGPMLRKPDIKNAEWMRAYEDRNVLIGLRHGFSGKGQIGKGMWAAPDRMREMLSAKIGHPHAGANTAWVPSPTAATLHATHYHRTDVFERQLERGKEAIPPLASLLTPPLASGSGWSREETQRELENNAQSVLGYVARWVEQGVGCSKVPDIDDIGLMEDRATLRISSQHIANWLRHGVVEAQQVDDALRRMAAKVDAQNAGDPGYTAMAGTDGNSFAFAAACALVFEGAGQPNGYTEPLLHRFRTAAKRSTT